MSRPFCFATLLLLGTVLLAAQAVPPLSPTAQGYAEFELGKWDELQAESHAGGDYVQQALDHYRAAMAANPSSAYIATQLADLLSRVGRTDEALTLARSVVKDHPASAEAHRALGQIYLRQLNQPRQMDSSANPAPTDNVMAEAVGEYQTLVQLDATDVADRIILGKLYGIEGQPAQAEQDFRAALLLQPTNADAFSSLIQALADQNKLDQAQQEIAALPPAARTGQIYSTLGDAYLHRRRFAEAAAAYRQAVQAEPDDPDIQSALAQSLMDGGDLPAALTEYQRLEQQTPDDGHTALRVAQLEMQLGQLDEASANLNTAAGLLSPDDIEVAYARALLDDSQGQETAAIAALRALVARNTNPSSQSIFLDQLGRIQMRTGDDAGALASFQKLEALGANYSNRAHGLEIELYTEERDYPQALAAVRAALADQPNSRPLQITYANLLSASGQPAAALAQLQPLLHGDATDEDVVLAQSQIEMVAKQWPQATADAQKADQLASTPAQHADALVQLAGVESLQLNYAAAEQNLQRALDLNPGSASALNALGYLLAEQDVRLPEALGYVQRAIERDSNNGAYLDSLGWIYFQMGQFPQAVPTLERAASLLRHSPDILDHLAQAYVSNGQLQQAATTWQQALQDLQQDPGRAAEIQKKLTAVRQRIARQQ